MAEQENAVDRFSSAMDTWISEQIGVQGVKHGETSHVLFKTTTYLSPKDAEELSRVASKHIGNALDLVRIRESIFSFTESLAEQLRPYGTPPVEILFQEYEPVIKEPKTVNNSGTLEKAHIVYSKLPPEEFETRNRIKLDGSGRPIPAALMDTPIEFLDLKSLPYNILKRNRVSTVGQILELSKEELLGLRNFGRGCLEQVLDKVLSHGILELSEQQPNIPEPLSMVSST